MAVYLKAILDGDLETIQAFIKANPDRNTPLSTRIWEDCDDTCAMSLIDAASITALMAPTAKVILDIPKCSIYVHKDLILDTQTNIKANRNVRKHWLLGMLDAFESLSEEERAIRFEFIMRNGVRPDDIEGTHAESLSQIKAALAQHPTQD